GVGEPAEALAERDRQEEPEHHLHARQCDAKLVQELGQLPVLARVLALAGVGPFAGVVAIGHTTAVRRAARRPCRGRRHVSHRSGPGNLRMTMRFRTPRDTETAGAAATESDAAEEARVQDWQEERLGQLGY